MENILHIGAKVSKEDATGFAEAVSTIFDSAHKNHMDQETVQLALTSFAQVFEVKNVTVTNSNFVGEDKRTTVNHSEVD